MSARGDRLGEGLADEVLQLIYGPRLARETTHVLGYMHAVSHAHLLMLTETGLIEAAAASTVAREMLALEDAGAAGLPNDPALEDLYFNYETALTKRLGIALGGSLHIGRSRNDIGATIDRLRARDEALALLSQVATVRRSLLDRARQYSDVVMPGYTHMQPSQPVSFGFYLLGPATAFSRETERLFAELARVDASPLGACAMAGTSFPIDRTRSAALLGFGSVADHNQDAVASRDWMIALASINASMAVLWSRLAQDFYIWSTMEFGMLDFPDSVAGVSSIMPQKKNPVVLEVLKANAGEVIGDLTAMLATMRASHFTHSIDATRASLNRAWASFETCRASLTLLALIVRTVTPRQERMAALTWANFSTMTDLADMLTQRYGLSFREAHHVVGGVVRSAIEAKVEPAGITPAMVAEAAGKVTASPLDCDAGTLAEAVDPAASLSRRLSAGSPAPGAIEAMLDREYGTLERDEAAIEASTARIHETRQSLRRSIESLAVRAV
ncbi:argininosuccinate lyase [Boseaceae bacterium BT-24-1]|nr:argininosuccinate lyase [Boseaceae bacterium BT-24-1]